MFIDAIQLHKFLEKDRSICQYLIGERVQHSRFGRGTINVINQDTKIIIAKFGVFGEKIVNFYNLDNETILGVFISDHAANKMSSKIKMIINHTRMDQGLKLINNALENYDFDLANKYYSNISDVLLKTKYEELIILAKDKQEADRIEDIKSKIGIALGAYKFTYAEDLYKRIEDKYPRDLFNKSIEKAKEKKKKYEQDKKHKALLKIIEDYLMKFDFKGANRIFENSWEKSDQSDYKNLVEKYKKKEDINKLREFLISDKFVDADKFYQTQTNIPFQEFLEIKSTYLKSYIERKYDQIINDEKAIALSYPENNILITARAGSGKTLLLALKAALLIDCYGYHPDQLMVMAFNVKARKEIKQRIQRTLNHPGFDNARTFHSLAYRLINPIQKILHDGNQHAVKSQKLSQFVQNIVKEKIKNPVFMDKLYEHFRAEMMELEKERFHLSDEEYLEYRRNLTYVTLDGLNVKSSGEKILADFLFEHNISYRYEDSKYWGKEIYRPDFSLYENQEDIIVEFWGIDESDQNKEVPEEWTLTWDEYYQQMQSKRLYCEENFIKLIEFSIVDLRNGREHFEEVISRKLNSSGILINKLPHEKLIEKVKENDRVISRITSLFTQFIQKSKNKMWTGREVQEKLKNYKSVDERERTFLDLATRVYLEYEELLLKEQKTDFDKLIHDAINLIHKTKGNCQINIGSDHTQRITMNRIKWILIDEYQDFSEKFYQLIDAIRKYNPEVKLFCVGDNWQAINGFAGSDLKFFDNFSNYIRPSYKENLVTNFRSNEIIIQWGNALMKGLGKPSTYLPKNKAGQVFIDYMDDVWIEQRTQFQYQTQKNNDEKFKIASPSLEKHKKTYYKITASKYLKLCHKIIKNKKSGTRKVAILARTNRIDGIPLNYFREKLINTLMIDSNMDKKTLEECLSVSTAHKFKGLEADMVIILEACNHSFPLIHPDNCLFYFFGENLQSVIAEEKRLFYVAISRPKSELYLLLDKNRETDYIDSIFTNDPNLIFSSIHSQENGLYNNWYDRSRMLNDNDDDMIPF